MKTLFSLFTIFCISLASCAPGISAEEISTNEFPVQLINTEQLTLQAPVTTQELTTNAPTARLTQTPIEKVSTARPTNTPKDFTCVTLLRPNNGAEISSEGKVTFSWIGTDEIDAYILAIILPPGKPVRFGTEQTYLDRYMEAFSTGGEYKWLVFAVGEDGSNKCISEVFTFTKPAYDQSQNP